MITAFSEKLPKLSEGQYARVYAFTGVSMIPALAIFIFAPRRLVGAIRG
jgi:ABC-type glycerol-3-phosphate transport system permease component